MSDLRRTFARASLAAIASLGLVAAACGGDDDDDDTPATTAAATTAATTAAASATTAAPAAYPVKVTDLLGRTVEIKEKPKAIVALSPTAVEYVYAVGGTVIGRSQTAVFPEAAKQAKEVGTAYQPSFEAILALKPDLVVADSVIHVDPRLKGPIEQLGVPVIFAGADSYKQVIDGLNLLGTALDAKAKAKEVITGIEKARDEARAAIAANKVSAVVLIAGRDNTLYSAKSTSFAGDILAQAGVTNPAAEGPDSGPGFPGYTTLAQEKLIQFNPDVIFAITPAPAPAPRLSTLVPTIPPFRALKAVTGGKVIELSLEPWLQAPGPRIADAFKELTAAVKPKP